jgi:hypothetical protein
MPQDELDLPNGPNAANLNTMGWDAWPNPNQEAQALHAS